MSAVRRRRRRALALALALAAAGCGQKGPPLAPLRPQPAQIRELTALRLGDEVHLQFTVPVQNADGSRPADLERIEIYGLTGPAVDRFGRPLGPEAFMSVATQVGSVSVRRPPAGDGAPDERSGVDQGQTVVLVERLTAALLDPPGPPEDGRGAEGAPDRAAGGPPPSSRPLIRLPWPETRRYMAVPYARGSRRGPVSPLVQVPLSPAPPPPLAPAVGYDETSVTVEWEPAPGARRLVQRAPAAGELPGRPLAHHAVVPQYNVYAAKEDTAGGLPAPLNRNPLSPRRFTEPLRAFGAEHCYRVRAVEAAGPRRVESVASPVTCVTPVDTFPPPAPTGLVAIASEGVISLIWEPSAASDLAGYLVLRGTAPDGDLQPLMDTPIREATYRDAEPEAGVRYVYAVVALDTADPPNVSEESNRAQETAR